MISFVTFKWKPRPGYRSKFGAQHVNTLASMLERNFKRPHRFICVTDDADGLDWGIETYPLWNDHSDLRNPTWPDGPSCFRRLRAFSKDFAAVAGPRFVCLDLDMVITGDVTPLFTRTEPFLMFRTHIPAIPLCGSIFAMNAGEFSHVWERFDANPAKAIGEMQRAGHRGSDQAWITHCLGAKVPGWSNKDGVYSYMELVPRKKPRRGAIPHDLPPRHSKLPENAKIVVFTGKPDPWDEEARLVSPWIDEHYR